MHNKRATNIKISNKKATKCKMYLVAILCKPNMYLK